MLTSGVATVVVDLIDAFRNCVIEHPNRPAIVHNGRSQSYVQLAESVAALTRPDPGVVPVPAIHHPQTVVAMLACWAGNGAYCPIDPGFPAQRRQDMLAIARAGASADAAYLLFTSGSTGRPKGVVTPRRAIATTVQSLRRLFELTPEDRVLQFASLNWDTCFEEILPTLTTGAALIFHDEAHTGSFPRFLRMIAEQGVTVLDLPTAFWHELVLHLSEERATLPGCVRLLIIGGEAVNPARLADWCTLDTGHVRLLNTYGCTETTLITHAMELTAPHTPVPIGWSLPHVLEHISEEGELFIGGPAIASGYLGAPADNRFVELAGVPYFRTGDRVERSPDGMLVHLGRLDNELKIRGVRVDPGEVEALIATHPAVTAVAVVGATVAGRTALLAYVVLRAPEDLSGHLRRHAPDHLIPSRITVVPELVLTSSGKVDRAGTHSRYLKEPVR